METDTKYMGMETDRKGVGMETDRKLRGWKLAEMCGDGNF
jgi:hypothetical protein